MSDHPHTKSIRLSHNADNKKKNEKPCLKVLELTFQTVQGFSPLSFSSFARKIQNSTPCDWLAKVWSSIWDINHLAASGSTVTFNRTLRSSSAFLAIMYNFIAWQHINKHDVVCDIIAHCVIGTSKHGKINSTSERAEEDIGRAMGTHQEHVREGMPASGSPDHMHTGTGRPVEGRTIVAETCAHGLHRRSSLPEVLGVIS
jgi:hypothetical protein